MYHQCRLPEQLDRHPGAEPPDVQPGSFMKTTSSRVEQGFSPALKDYLERRLSATGVQVLLQRRTTSGAEARIVPVLPCRPEGLLHPNS